MTFIFFKFGGNSPDAHFDVTRERSQGQGAQRASLSWEPSTGPGWEARSFQAFSTSQSKSHQGCLKYIKPLQRPKHNLLSLATTVRDLVNPDERLFFQPGYYYLLHPSCLSGQNFVLNKGVVLWIDCPQIKSRRDTGKEGRRQTQSFKQKAKRGWSS